jgi:hypothetical protein
MGLRGTLLAPSGAAEANRRTPSPRHHPLRTGAEHARGERGWPRRALAEAAMYPHLRLELLERGVPPHRCVWTSHPAARVENPR